MPYGNQACSNIGALPCWASYSNTTIRITATTATMTAPTIHTTAWLGRSGATWWKMHSLGWWQSH